MNEKKAEQKSEDNNDENAGQESEDDDEEYGDAVENSHASPTDDGKETEPRTEPRTEPLQLRQPAAVESGNKEKDEQQDMSKEKKPSPTDLVKILLGETLVEEFAATIIDWVKLEDE